MAPFFRKVSWFWAFFLLLANSSYSQSIHGTVVDSAKGEPMAGVWVKVVNYAIYDFTDSTGQFQLDSLPLGTVTVWMKNGEESMTLGQFEVVEDSLIDVEVVFVPSPTVPEIDMRDYISAIPPETSMPPPQVNLATVLIFEQLPKGISSRYITFDQMKRHAAVFLDPARVATAFPGVVQDNDQANHLVVRGNSPNGVLWRMEGADILNPNHLSNAGTFSDRISLSGGGTTMLSAQMLGATTFDMGAFETPVGNALSAAFDVGLRTGNRKKHKFTAQFGLIGVDLAAEGPLSREKGASYLVNYRYSTVGLLGLMGISFGDEAINYQDLSFHFFLPGKKNGLTKIWGLAGNSFNRFSGQESDSLVTTGKERYNIDFSSRMLAVGARHVKRWGYALEWNTSLAWSAQENRRVEGLIRSNAPDLNTAQDQIDRDRISLHTWLRWEPFGKLNLYLGGLVNWDRFSVLATRTFPGSTEPLTWMNGENDAVLAQPYLRIKWDISRLWALQGGIHANYFTLNGSRNLEPRFSLSRSRGDGKQGLQLAYSRVSQVQSPLTYFYQIRNAANIVVRPNQNLGFTQADHLVFSYRYWVTHRSHFRIEPYYQWLSNVPVGIRPGSALSTLNLLEGYVTDSLVNGGAGRNFGLDLSFERRFHNRFYLFVAASVYDSKYRDLEGNWYNTRWNGRFALSGTGGYETRQRMGRKGVRYNLGFNGRMVYRGGLRSQPIDLAASRALGETVFDQTQGFTEKWPDYLRADLQLSWKRFGPKITGTLSLDLQNALNIQNVAYQYFDPVADGIVTRYQLGLIPILSYRMEF